MSGGAKKIKELPLAVSFGDTDHVLGVVNGKTQLIVKGLLDNQGSSGSSGASGVDGVSGINGVDGVSGVNGYSGTSGISGINGVNGISGVNGLNGVDGISGVNGLNGISGINGLNGQDGVSGINGVSGISGVNGLNGSNGVSGVNGTSGTSGTNGIDTSILTINTQTGDYTIQLVDRNSLVEITGDSNSIALINVYIPDNSTVAFPIGSQILVIRGGTSEVKINANEGVSVFSPSGNLSLNNQYSGCTLIKKDTNIWYLLGDLK